MNKAERKGNLTDRGESLSFCVYALFLIQPVLDIAGYWQQQMGLSSVLTLTIRCLILSATVAGGFLLSNKKKVYIVSACILALLTVLHADACLHMPQGYREPVTDFVNLMRIYSLPLMTISLITFLRTSKKVFPAMLKGIASVLMIDAAVMFVSALTGTDPHTYNFTLYDTVSYGVRGWFLWTNSQSAILSMLYPISICYFSRRYPGRILPVWLSAAAGGGALFFLAPRLAFASLAVGGVCSAGGLMLSGRISPDIEQIINNTEITTASAVGGRKNRQAAAVLLITVLFVACYPLSPGHRRISYFDLEREGISNKVTGLGLSEETLDDEERDDRLEELYRSQDLLWSAIDRFGRDRVFAAYRYTTDPEILRNMRTKKIVFCRLLMEDAGIRGRLFGLNLKDMTVNRIDRNGVLTTDNYDVENDFHGIYFLTGMSGFVLMIAFLAGFVIRGLFAVFRQPRKYLTPVMMSLGCAFGLAIIHALFTASILRRNNASVYLAAVLAGIWVLSER